VVSHGRGLFFINLFFVSRYLSFVRIVCLLAFWLVGCVKKNTAPPPVVPPAPVVVGLKNVLPVVLKESSGLCFTGGSLWSFGDSGNPNSIYKIDSASSAILQTVTISNFPNADWESITADSSYIYIGDLGNNDGDRKDLVILRIKKADISPSLSQTDVKAEAIHVAYADQTDFTSNSNTNFDCEAMISMGGSLYLFSKDRGDLRTRCYKVPKEPGSYVLTPVSTFNTSGKVTDAAYNASTGELALLGYMNRDLNSFIWLFDGYKGDDFFSGTSKRYTIGVSNTEWQTEGLTYLSAKRLLLSCESTASHPASLFFVQVQ